MHKPPKKGSIEWVPWPAQAAEAQPAAKDLQLGLRYVGAREVRRWTLQMQRNAADEASRLAKRRAEYPREAWPELYEADYITPEFVEANALVQDEVLAAVVAGVKGVDGMADDDAKAALGLLEFLGPAAEGAVFAAAIDHQSLDRRASFRGQGAGS